VGPTGSGEEKIPFPLSGHGLLHTVRDFELIPVLTQTKRDHLLIAVHNPVFMKLFGI
jgi:hypothetical protein